MSSATARLYPSFSASIAAPALHVPLSERVSSSSPQCNWDLPAALEPPCLQQLTSTCTLSAEALGRMGSFWAGPHLSRHPAQRMCALPAALDPRRQQQLTSACTCQPPWSRSATAPSRPEHACRRLFCSRRRSPTASGARRLQLPPAFQHQLQAAAQVLPWTVLQV